MFSGGQKVRMIAQIVGISDHAFRQARVTLARAVYSSASVLLLDDIFAALDAHTYVLRTILLAVYLTPLAEHYLFSNVASTVISSRDALSSLWYVDCNYKGFF